MPTIRQKISLIVAAMVLAASFASSVHVHFHVSAAGDQASPVATSCSCGIVHQTFEDESSPASSVPADSPCDHSDCQLCKFISEFGFVDSVEIEIQSQAFTQFRQHVGSPNYLSDIASVYQSRGPPTA